MTYGIANDQKGDLYYGLIRPEILDLIPMGAARIMDVGCARGDLGAAAKQARGVREVVGVEAYEPVAAIARTKLDHVIIADIEDLPLPFDSESFDCIICADVLEHTRDPWRVLANLRPLLRRDGILIVSLPNLRHIVPILKIVFNRFHYEDQGILDRTHLRFFTLSTMKQLVEGAGFSVFNISSNKSHSTKFTLLHIASFGLLKKFAIFQYILAARRRI